MTRLKTDYRLRLNADQLIQHAFICRGKQLNSRRMIKELVKSKMKDLEDNRERNFQKEINVRHNQNIPSELILKDPRPESCGLAAEQHSVSKHDAYSESDESDLRMFDYLSKNNQGGHEK